MSDALRRLLPFSAPIYGKTKAKFEEISGCDPHGNEVDVKIREFERTMADMIFAGVEPDAMKATIDAYARNRELWDQVIHCETKHKTNIPSS